MAYTKIKPVRHHLQRCLDYTSNPQKTETFSANDLNCLLSYTQNQDKTEHQLYVTGFNCTPADACRRMYRTKKRLNQPVDDGSILAYHIIQSFSPGEATPEQVHQIGCEFARRFLADRFECTVSTHLDKGHLHNHVVVNSVSYMDGKMFRNDFATYYQGIRKISDELCRENRLSVIETDGKGQGYISCDIILQSKSQIQSLYKDDWEGMIGNCDSLIYLGGNEYATFEWLSKYIGKMTERTKSQSIGRGSRGSSSDSYQLTARDLCSPDEIRRMDDGDCLVLLRSEPPVIDHKFDLMRHPNVKLTPDGGAAPYRTPAGTP